MAAKNDILRDKDGNQIFPATTAEQVSYDGKINVKQAIKRGAVRNKVAPTVASMTDKEQIYVYTGTEEGYTFGNWYYWNGTAWTSGGAYNAIEVNTDGTLTEEGAPADAKATGLRIDSLKDDLENANNNIFNEKQTVINVSYDSNTFPDTSNGVLTTNVNYSSGSIQVEEGEKYHIEGWSYYEVALYGLLDSAGNLIDRYPKVAEKSKQHSVDIRIPNGCTTLMIGKRSPIQATTYIPTVIKISYDSRIEKLENESIPLKSSLDALDISCSNFGQKPSACITLIDDDGYPEHIPTIKNICDNLGIKCTFAVNTGKWTNNDVISLLQNYQNEGFHITSHSHNHSKKWSWGQSTTEDDKRILYEDMLKSYQLLEQNGFLDFRMFVTPNGGFDSIVKEIVKNWSDCLVTTQEGINVNFKNLFVLKRTFINKTTGNHDLQYYKDMIDSAISTGGWLIFGTHSGDVEWNGNDFDSELVTNVLQYAKYKNVEILPLNSAYKKRKRYYDLYNLFGN